MTCPVCSLEKCEGHERIEDAREFPHPYTTPFIYRAELKWCAECAAAVESCNHLTEESP